MNFVLTPKAFGAEILILTYLSPVAMEILWQSEDTNHIVFSIMRTEWILVGILGFGVLLFCGCNRAAVRFYGASTDFPPNNNRVCLKNKPPLHHRGDNAC